MKKCFFILLAAGTLLMGCNSDKTPEATKVEETTNVSPTATVPDTAAKTLDTAVAKKTTKAQSSEAKATAELCDCINSSLKGMSPKVQNIFIRAGNSDRPLQVLQNEIVTISDAEQMELFEQLQRFSSEPQLQKCTDDIRKKYGLDDNDRQAQERFLQSAKANKDCELVYALIKIGMQQQPGAQTGN
ncbi:MAG: hypothetical protein EOO14_03540 [Chitinophagaceae bacterium]|nr:MAG: hypothetical protein EOO14_03540 [Chitinophagaceae bacterium]